MCDRFAADGARMMIDIECKSIRGVESAYDGDRRCMFVEIELTDKQARAMFQVLAETLRHRGVNVVALAA